MRVRVRAVCGWGGGQRVSSQGPAARSVLTCHEMRQYWGSSGANACAADAVVCAVALAHAASGDADTALRLVLGTALLFMDASATDYVSFADACVAARARALDGRICRMVRHVTDRRYEEFSAAYGTVGTHAAAARGLGPPPPPPSSRLQDVDAPDSDVAHAAARVVALFEGRGGGASISAFDCAATALRARCVACVDIACILLSVPHAQSAVARACDAAVAFAAVALRLELRYGEAAWPDVAPMPEVEAAVECIVAACRLDGRPEAANAVLPARARAAAARCGAALANARHAAGVAALCGGPLAAPATPADAAGDAHARLEALGLDDQPADIGALLLGCGFRGATNAAGDGACAEACARVLGRYAGRVPRALEGAYATALCACAGLARASAGSPWCPAADGGAAHEECHALSRVMLLLRCAGTRRRGGGGLSDGSATDGSATDGSALEAKAAAEVDAVGVCAIADALCACGDAPGAVQLLRAPVCEALQALHRHRGLDAPAENPAAAAATIGACLLMYSCGVAGQLDWVTRLGRAASGALLCGSSVSIRWRAAVSAAVVWGQALCGSSGAAAEHGDGSVPLDAGDARAVVWRLPAGEAAWAVALACLLDERTALLHGATRLAAAVAASASSESWALPLRACVAAAAARACASREAMAACAPRVLPALLAAVAAAASRGWAPSLLDARLLCRLAARVTGRPPAWSRTGAGADVWSRTVAGGARTCTPGAAAAVLAAAHDARLSGGDASGYAPALALLAGTGAPLDAEAAAWLGVYAGVLGERRRGGDGGMHNRMGGGDGGMHNRMGGGADGSDDIGDAVDVMPVAAEASVVLRWALSDLAAAARAALAAEWLPASPISPLREGLEARWRSPPLMGALYDCSAAARTVTHSPIAAAGGACACAPLPIALPPGVPRAALLDRLVRTTAALLPEPRGGGGGRSPGGRAGSPLRQPQADRGASLTPSPLRLGMGPADAPAGAPPPLFSPGGGGGGGDAGAVLVLAEAEDNVRARAQWVKGGAGGRAAASPAPGAPPRSHAAEDAAAIAARHEASAGALAHAAAVSSELERMVEAALAAAESGDAALAAARSDADGLLPPPPPAHLLPALALARTAAGGGGGGSPRARATSGGGGGATAASQLEDARARLGDLHAVRAALAAEEASLAAELADGARGGGGGDGGMPNRIGRALYERYCEQAAELCAAAAGAAADAAGGADPTAGVDGGSVSPADSDDDGDVGRPWEWRNAAAAATAAAAAAGDAGTEALRRRTAEAAADAATFGAACAGAERAVRGTPATAAALHGALNSLRASARALEAEAAAEAAAVVGMEKEVACYRAALEGRRAGAAEVAARAAATAEALRARVAALEAAAAQDAVASASSATAVRVHASAREIPTAVAAAVAAYERELRRMQAVAVAAASARCVALARAREGLVEQLEHARVALAAARAETARTGGGGGGSEGSSGDEGADGARGRGGGGAGRRRESRVSLAAELARLSGVVGEEDAMGALGCVWTAPQARARRCAVA